jgi:hypothetical protein
VTRAGERSAPESMSEPIGSEVDRIDTESYDRCARGVFFGLVVAGLLAIPRRS